MLRPAIFVAVFLATIPAQASSSTAADSSAKAPVVTPPAIHGPARSLFCMTGFKGLTGPGEDTEAAEAIVEIYSPRALAKVTATDFCLWDRDGHEVSPHIVSVEVFDRAHIPTEGSAAYYLNPGGTTPWDGKIPARPIRLRVRAEFSTTGFMFFTRFRVKIGPYIIDGPLDGMWPS